MKYLIVMCLSNESELEKQKLQYETLKQICADAGICAEGCIFRYENDQRVTSVIAEHLIKSNDYQGILVTECEIGAELAGLLAAKLQWACLADVNRLCGNRQELKLYKAVYHCNMEAVYSIKERFVVSMKGLMAEEHAGACASDFREIYLPICKNPSFLFDRKLKERHIQQGGKGVLLAVGQGIQSREDVEKIRSFAYEQGYLFGVSRPVAMNGWAGIREIIGVSGHIYAPKICIAIGVSGSAAFYAGIENSQKIFSVNNDRKAPIMKMSDVAIVADYREIWEDLQHMFRSGGLL